MNPIPAVPMEAKRPVIGYGNSRRRDDGARLALAGRRRAASLPTTFYHVSPRH